MTNRMSILPQPFAGPEVSGPGRSGSLPVEVPKVLDADSVPLDALVVLPELEPVELSELEPVKLDVVSGTVVSPVVVDARSDVPPQAPLKRPSNRIFRGRRLGLRATAA